MAKLIMVGECPNCGALITSRYPFEIGICRCSNPAVQVPLQLAIVMPPRFQKAIEVVEKHSGITGEKLLTELLHELSEALVRGWKTHERRE